LSHTFHRAPLGLPALNELDHPVFDCVRNSDSILNFLRQTALKSRSDHLQPFYSIRAVAEHFHVPPATVARIYRRLSRERVLRTVWGSKTLLEPQSPKNGECRSIGIPVNLDRFGTSLDYRAGIISLQMEVWNHEVVEHILFFEQGDEVLLLCTRNHHPDIDAIVWLLPEAAHKQTLLQLHDLGIRIICLSNQAISGVRHCYTISPRCTIRSVLRKEVLNI